MNVFKLSSIASHYITQLARSNLHTYPTNNILLYFKHIIFTKTDHHLDHKDYLDKFPKIYIVQAILTDHS